MYTVTDYTVQASVNGLPMHFPTAQKTVNQFLLNALTGRKNVFNKAAWFERWLVGM